MSVSSAIKEEKFTLIGRVREFYTEIEGNDEKLRYKCKFCERIYNGKSGSNLTAHIRNKHSDVFHSEISNDNDHIKVRRLKLVYSCVELVTINSHPFSLLTQSGFLHAIEDKLQNLKLAGCCLNLSDPHVNEIKDKVREISEIMKERIKSEVKGKIISVMCDSATRNGRAIFGISIQYKYDGKLKIVSIGMCELLQSHTAEHLAEIMEGVFAKYEISLWQVLSITTDNGLNMLAMVKELQQSAEEVQVDIDSEDHSKFMNDFNQSVTDLSSVSDECNIDDVIADLLSNRSVGDDDALNILLDENETYDELFENLICNLRNRGGNSLLFVISIKCAAHTLQLAIKDALKMMPEEVLNVIKLCREAAKFLRQQSTKNEMRRLGITTILPPLDVVTRWSSTFCMV